MSYKLPINGKWKRGSDGYADIVAGRNISFDKKGRVQLAPQPITLYTSTQSSTVGVLQAIVNDYFVTASASGRVFLLTTTTGAITQQTVTNEVITVGSDAVFYKGLLTVSTGNQSVETLSAGTWTTQINAAFSTSFPHPLAVFENRRTICVGNGNTVWQSTTSAYANDASNSLTIPDEYIVTWLRWRQNQLYIGTRHRYGGKAKLFIWNGQGTSAQQGFSTNSDWIFSGADYLSSIVVIGSDGLLQRFNGGGFDKLAHLPVAETQLSWSKSNAATASSTGRVTNRGMIADGDNLFIVLDGSVQGNPDFSYLPEQPSGLWCYNPENGLAHRAGFTSTQYSTLTIDDNSSSLLRTTSVHNLETGDPVRAVSVSNLTELTAGRDYYAIKSDTTHFYLANSFADAIAGRYINIATVPSGDTISVNSTELGAVSQDTIPGAVGLISSTNISTPFFGSRVLYGGQAPDTTNTLIKSMNALGTGRNKGYFVTSSFPSKSIKDIFQKLLLEIETLASDSDQIVVKYKTRNTVGLPTPARYSNSGIGVWLSTTTLSVNSLYKDVKSASVGDEVEITGGSGAGNLAHITAIDTSTNTYVFTIDETLPVTASDQCEFVIDGWKKAGVITKDISTIADGFVETILGVTGSWIQFKVELRGRTIPITKLSIVTTPHKT